MLTSWPCSAGGTASQILESNSSMKPDQALTGSPGPLKAELWCVKSITISCESVMSYGLREHQAWW